MASTDQEGVLLVEIFKTYEEVYATFTGRKFQAFKKIKANLVASPANKAELAVQFDVHPNECECKAVKFSVADLARIMKSSKLNDPPFFFSVTVHEKVYMLAARSEAERTTWVRHIRELGKDKDKDRKSDAWIGAGFLKDNDYRPQEVNRFTNSPKPALLPSQRVGLKLEKPDASKGGPRDRSGGKEAEYKKIETMHDADSDSDADDAKEAPAAERRPPRYATDDDISPGPSLRSRTFSEEEDEAAADPEGESLWCCKHKERVVGVKVDTLVRLLKVCLAFPFVIVVSSLNLSNQYAFLRSITGVRIMNILIYVAPVVYVKFVLSQFENPSVQRIAIGFYIFLYLLPVGLVVFTKVKVSSSTSKIEEGTFCFKPARTVRFTQANFYALMGFVMEWVQHLLYVLPTGIVTSDTASKLSDFPPYLPFKVYFWCAVSSTFICGIIIILNTVLKGKIHYRFQNSYVVWFFLFNVGSPMFVTIVTILFMSLWCDYSVDPPVLIQQPSLVCYSDEHVTMARAALIAVAIYIIQHTLLPSGTFKETMRNNDLEIMFVPVYLQAHYLLKAIFSGVYVYFYTANVTRVIALTFINMLLLVLNNFMKPCSVSWVNLLRDCFFIHAVLSGIISINYLVWGEDVHLKGMVISTLASTVLFSSVGIYAYHRYTTRSTEYSIASAFLDLEWQVSRGGAVHPRVLEPLISLTLSLEAHDWEIAKKYIGQLVWLISYPNMRVQFQSAWGLANLALLDDDARMQIHDAGGTKTLFEWYMEMDFVVQLETLAAIVNLTLCMKVAEDMVVRNKCIPFFISLVTSNKMKHAQFAAIALANLARKEAFREMIRRNGGIPALVGCIMSHDYQKRRHGCRALANMALSPSKEMEQVFESKGLVDRIIKMALRQEIETQREVVALIRNLSCHARLRPMMLDRGVMKAVEVSKSSIFKDVQQWCEEITLLLQREVSTGNIDLKALMRREGAKGNTIGEADVDLLKKMEPLQGKVEWSTWGSKLESIFAPIFSVLPSITSSQVVTPINTPVQVLLPHGVARTELARWRDSLAYSVIERPAHGKLSEYTTASDYVTYIPSPGYVGADFFIYRMQVGSILTAPATCAVKIVGTTNSLPTATAAAAGTRASGEDVPETPSESPRRGRRGPTPEDDLEAGARIGRQAPHRSPSSVGIRKKKSTPKAATPAGEDEAELGMEMVYPSEENIEAGAKPTRKASMHDPSAPTPFMQSLMKKTSLHVLRDDDKSATSSTRHAANES